MKNQNRLQLSTSDDEKYTNEKWKDTNYLENLNTLHAYKKQ
jgi:hypothetical protein